MRKLALATLTGLLVACSGPAEPPAPSPPAPKAPGGTTAAEPSDSAPPPSSPADPSPAQPSRTPLDETDETHEFTVTEHESFDEPWAMAFLPGTDALVITERGGTIKLRDASGVREVSGAPEVVYAGQGGLGDIVAGPTFAQDGTVYLSWAQAGDGGSGAVVGRGTLDVAAATLTGLSVIWEQTPRTDGDGHFAHRLAIDGEHLFVSSGDRKEQTPAQEFDNNLGKILRLTLDGQPAPGNPFAGEDSPTAQQFWSIGHRNVLGLAFDPEGRLWASEMGPKGGDELNLVVAGANYGWPEVSNGSKYSGGEIPDHADGDGFEAPKVWWNPSISPGSLMIYTGELFPGWRGDAFIGALSGKALIRVELDGEEATEEENWPMDQRIRAVAEAPDGAIWLLEDRAGGRLLELRPA